MKILLLGEYSNVHWTLAQGLRALGHKVTVISDGDGWKDYPRDISLKRKSTGKADTMAYLLKLASLLPRMTGYDIVQFINPIFVELCPERIYHIFDFLRKFNKKVILGAFGMDYFWVKTGLERQAFRYSDFNIGNELRLNEDNDKFVSEWIFGIKGRLNRYMAGRCDGIVSGLYEYDVCYRLVFPQKTRFIPFPVNLSETKPLTPRPETDRIRFFIGIQKTRNAYKGTDIMYKALLRLAEHYPHRMEIIKAESVPYAEYHRMMEGCDVILDQLYSYTPAMNALQAMAKGLVVVGGGEEENYEIIGESELRPIINVTPSEEDVYAQLEKLLLNPDELKKLSIQSKLYISKHHDHLKVAAKYVEYWSEILASKARKRL